MATVFLFVRTFIGNQKRSILYKKNVYYIKKIKHGSKTIKKEIFHSYVISSIFFVFYHSRFNTFTTVPDF